MGPVASKLSLFPAELRPRRLCFLAVVLLPMAGCGPTLGPPLTADLPLHLEDHLDAAVVRGSEIPGEIPRSVEWRFDEPQPGWKTTTGPIPPGAQPPTVNQVGDALQIIPGDLADPRGRLVGSVYTEVPSWDHRDWAHVTIRARCSGPGELELGFNLSDEGGAFPFGDWGTQVNTPLVGDSLVHTYQLSMEPATRGEEPIDQFGVWFASSGPQTVEILSISVSPKEALYAEEPTGVREVERGGHYRRTLFVHTPARVQYRVKVPEDGRLDMGLGTLRSESSVRFRVTVAWDGAPADTVLEESHADPRAWAQTSLDLSAYRGQVVTLSLEADSENAGSVALWGAPTLTGPRASGRPNVILYIIDGAGAEYLSVYGYNRHTTPNLERLASEGALFEHAYSNASWTQPSTASFMTSLQTSVMGGASVPENATSMAQRMHAGDYQTAVFTANPNAGRLAGLERGVDFFQEGWEEFSYWDETGNWNQSSSYLHESFWEWREAFPGEPYWVHFQTVDIHGDFPTPAPFGGLFVSPEEATLWEEWMNRLRERGVHWNTDRNALEMAGVARVPFFTLLQGMYDEALANNDYQIGRLVERLKATGEWGNTLLVIGADHSIAAAVGDMRFFLQDSLPPSLALGHPYLRPSISRVPLMFIWPGHISGGQRFSEPAVSMIDVLPTILDLAGLPLPEIMQGQSLAPLLLGTGGVEQRPVILDEFVLDQQTGELLGILEVIDGRWGASLEIKPDPAGRARSEMWRRPVPFLLYDLWKDPYCLHSIHEERPDLAARYTAFLNEQFEAHQALRQYFTASEDPVLTPEQLEMLRTLGYIR